MKYFIVEYEGEFLIRLQDYSKGIWTLDKEKAHIHKYEIDREFYKKHYPQFNVIDVEEN